MNKILLLTITMLCIGTTNAQTNETYYYKLIKIIEKDRENTSVTGGQFITFTKYTCYDSDNNGQSVNNGIMYLKSGNKSDLKTYSGKCYYGNAVYKFKSDYSVLNIEINSSLIYVYKKTPPPSNQITSSLIKKRSSSNSYSETQMYSNSNPSTFGNSYLEYNNNSTTTTNTSREKTKVRKKCAYCSGKGEWIQHEYVSTFGLDGPRVHCNVCNQSWNYGTVHAHHKCNHCNGTGYYEYEY